MLPGLLAVAVLATLAVLGAADPDCKSAPLAGTPICDASLPVLTRAQWIVSQFNISEKAVQLQNGSPGVARMGIPAYQWWSEALHGVANSPGVKFASSGNFSCATSFPEPIGIAAGFDRDIVNKIAGVTSDEGRAFFNAGRAGNTFWTPNINMFRDPRWGRGQETPGEDPYLSSEYAYSLITGYQVGEDPRYYKVVPDSKHYAGYDLEDWDGNDRLSYNALISDLDLSESYLPAFKSAVKDARVGSMMCSYNAVNGIPSCANSRFMTQIAREQWGFDGWVTSDCGALAGIYDYHHYAANHSQQVQMALRAGCDIGCDTVYAQYGPQAVVDGSISAADLDNALIRLYSSQIRWGYFDDPTMQPYKRYGHEKVATASSVALSEQAARQSLVLLKNDGTLPIAKGSVTTVAVLGPNANAPGSQIGNYAGNACFMHTPTDGFSGLGFKVNYAMGCDVNSTRTSGFAAALAAAAASDLIVFVGGIDDSIEAEGHDRDTIDLPGQQLPLLQQLEAVGKPLIVVLFGGGGVDVSYLSGSSKTNAIIWAGYPSQSGGDAIGDLIVGNFSPSGKLPVTWYPASYVTEVPMTDQNMRPSSSNPGRTYRFYTGTPVYAFGTGLSYSSFTYNTLSSPPKLSIDALIDAARADDRSLAASWTVNITNVGPFNSDLVVLAFISSNASIAGVSPPITELYDFTHLYSLMVGESRVVSFGLNFRVFGHVDQDGNSWLLPGTYRLHLDVEKHIEAEFELVGRPAMVEMMPPRTDDSEEVVGRASVLPSKIAAETM